MTITEIWPFAPLIDSSLVAKNTDFFTFDKIRLVRSDDKSRI